MNCLYAYHPYTYIHGFKKNRCFSIQQQQLEQLYCHAEALSSYREDENHYTWIPKQIQFNLKIPIIYQLMESKYSITNISLYTFSVINF